uniref:Reverse transcriptase domain-containing protein n=1 Tax=Tanacetum cinerariifolium TaxID=118510 RepID=A0A6L2JY50_TANCI|nr:reverse transcriptase domain-containing protein [Tanacetum cinerariifolium]
MAKKFNQEKRKNEKLKELKARLNFEGCSVTSRYFESKTMNTKEHDKRHRSRRSRSPRTSVFSRIRRERSRSPIRRERSRSPRKKVKEGGVFKRLGSKGKSVSARSDSYNNHSHSRYTEALSESEDIRGNARVWFDDLPPESIDSYDNLKKAFLENYLQQKKYIKDPIEHHNIKQRDEGSTEDFVRRYKLESRDVKGAPECMKISGFVHGITNPELIKHLTMDEMMRVTTSFLLGEVAASNHERKKSFPLWKQHEGNQNFFFKKEVFGANKGKGKFKALPPMTTPVEKRNHAKLCEFHGEVGHNMKECMHQRKHIEEILKAGKLSHLIKEIKQNNGKEQPKVTKKGETSEKDKALSILMVQPWERVARQRITRSFSPNLEIFFPPLGEDEGTKGPMIIEAEIGGHCVHRMYVDSVSASEIMYEHCFSRLRLEIKKHLIPDTTPLIGVPTRCALNTEITAVVA